MIAAKHRRSIGETSEKHRRSIGEASEKHWIRQADFGRDVDVKRLYEKAVRIENT